MRSCAESFECENCVCVPQKHGQAAEAWEWNARTRAGMLSILLCFSFHESVLNQRFKRQNVTNGKEVSIDKLC